MTAAEIINIIVALTTLVTAIKAMLDVRKVHVLTNSNMGVQLGMNAELSEWKADRTKNDTDRVAAKESRLYNEHVDKQQEVDGRIF